MSRWVIVLAAATACSASQDPVVEATVFGSARVLSPGCAGSGYTTIQSAINAAIDGDIVEMCSGTFNERLEISGKALTLRSRTGATAILDGTGGTAIKLRNGANVILQGLTIRNGSSTGTGGNLSCSSSTFELRSSIVEHGQAAKGGGVGSSSCTGTVTGNTFRFNSASDKGGGLYASPGVVLTNNRFEDNDAEVEGGGAYMKDANQLVQGNTFLRNLSLDDGGGLMIYRGSPIIDANHFEDNEADEEGGGLRIKSSSATITNNTLVHNKADWRGGGSKISHDEVTMSGNVFEDNRSYGSAGALLLYESASLLQHETYRNNHSDDGGAVSIREGWGSVTIEDSVFQDNVADERGGHLFVDLLRYKTKLRRVDFLGGSAEDGGAVYATSESNLEDWDPYNPDPNYVWYYTGVQFENTLFEDNVATIAGGALYFDQVDGWLRNNLLIQNSAPVAAGLDITNGRGGYLDLQNNIFRSNTGGAAIETTTGSRPDVYYNDFNGNTLNFAGMPDVSGTNGNRTSSPGFVNEATGDYHLTATSALIDRGDPSITDGNGTRSDIGLYGGPRAE